MSQRKTLRKILRGAIWTFVGILVVILVILLFFTISTILRESKTYMEAAPSTGRFIHAGDIDVFIQEAGVKTGHPVLLIHGTGAWSEIWRGTMTTLSEKGFYVIAIDVPPFGYSEKPKGAESYSRENQANRIIRVLEALNISNVTIVCHSVGCRPGIEAVLKSPDKIGSLVVVDPALGFAPNSTTSQFQQNKPSLLIKTVFNIKSLRNSCLATYGTNPIFIKKLFSSFVFNKEEVTDERVEMLKKPLVVEGMTRAQADWLQYLIISKDNSLSTDFMNFKMLEMPVLIIWGDADDVTLLWQGEELNRLIPQSELVIIKNTGHIPYIENQKEFDDVLIKFLVMNQSYEQK